MASANFDRYDLGWDQTDLGATRISDNVREDLSNMIYNIAPWQTPYMTAAGTGRARNIYSEWQTDDLGTIEADNARIDGDDAGALRPGVPPSAATRVGNHMQISDKVIRISGRAEAVDTAGRRSEMGYQLAKAGKGLKRDMEAIMTTNQASAGGDSGNPSKTGGVPAWIVTNLDLGGGAPVIGGWQNGLVVAHTPGTPRNLTESLIRTGMQNAYLEGGEPGTLMMSPQKKQALSEYLFTSSARVATLYKDTQGEGTGQSTATGAVDVFVTDFGALKLVPNRFWGHDGSAPNDTYVAGLQMNMWGTLYLRSFRTNRLAKTGDAENRQLIVDYGVRANNEASSFLIMALDNAPISAQ